MFRIRLFFDLRIADVSGSVFNVDVDLIQGQVTEIVINKTFEGNEIQITLPSEISVYTNSPNCGIGCGGSHKNECVRVKGLSNGVANTTQAYGIECFVTCICDINTLVCDMATNQLIGQTAYELCGAMFYDEMPKNKRLNYLTIYKEEQITQQAQAGFAMYQQYLTNAMNGVRQFLVNSDGGCKCIDCSGVQFKTNV